MTEVSTAPEDGTVTESLLSQIEPELPVELDQTVTAVTHSLVNQFNNDCPEANRKPETIALTSLSIGLRQTDLYVPDSELSDALHALISGGDRFIRPDAEFRYVGKREIKRTRRQMITDLNLPVEPTRPADHAHRIRESGIISDGIVDDALDFIDRVPTKEYSGCKPSCVLGGAVYTVAITRGESVTQQDVADLLDISQVSVRNQFQSLVETNVIPCY